MDLTKNQVQGVKNIAHVLYGVAMNLGDGKNKNLFDLCDEAADNFDNLSEEKKTKLKMATKSALQHIINITPR